MKEIWNLIQVAFAAVGGWLGWVLGGLDGFLYALIAFVVIDYLTGVMCAIADKKLSSEVGFRGICKKILIFAMVAAGHILDTHILGSGAALRTAILFFYIANEGVSLLENTTRLGLPVPEKLKNALAQLHGKTDPSDEEGEHEYIHPPHPDPLVGKEEEEENDHDD